MYKRKTESFSHGRKAAVSLMDGKFNCFMCRGRIRILSMSALFTRRKYNTRAKAPYYAPRGVPLILSWLAALKYNSALV